MLANVISVKEQLTDIKRYISGLLSPEKYMGKIYRKKVTFWCIHQAL